MPFVVMALCLVAGRGPRRCLAEPFCQFHFESPVIDAVFPPLLDQIRNIAAFRQLWKPDYAHFGSNALESGADRSLVLLPAIIMVAKDEDTPAFEVGMSSAHHLPSPP